MTMTYKNLGGPHALLAAKGEDPVVIPHGAVFDSEENDLCERFPNKFQKVHPSEKGAPETAEGDQDVTTDFPTAAENDLTVLKNKKGWWVYDEGDEPLNEKALKKGGVNDFIAEYVED